MRLLPRDQRHAMYAIYAYCRAVDDVADGPEGQGSRFAALEQWRAEVDGLYRGTVSSRLARLAGPIATFGLQRDDFLAILDGVEMDALADIVAPDWATLDLYCDRVASAVGRLCVRVFGLTGSDGIALAFDLGRALQLTNILRDLDEDATKGRLYLPREALAAAGIAPVPIGASLGHPRLDAACAEVVSRARGHFAAAHRVMARHPGRVVRAPMLMAKVYETMLDRLVARGFAAPRPNVRPSRGAVLWTLVRYGLRPRDGTG